MSRSNIVKSVDDNVKRHIVNLYIVKEEKTKTALAKRFNISTRTLNRILDEYSTTQNFHWDYCITKNEITVLRNGEARTITKTFPKFNDMKKRFCVDGFGDETLSYVFDNMCLKNVINTFSEGNLTVNHEDGTIHYGNFEIKNSLVTQIMKMLDKGQSVLGMVRFLDKLMSNPDERIVEQLYPFMKHNDIHISDEGDIIAYRSVTLDYKDFHTKTMDNSVGSVVKMPRSLVDCNPENTCSSGIHCASISYAKGFGGSNERLMLVKVDPKNVCSVPVDYSRQKMRVCELLIESEVAGDK